MQWAKILDKKENHVYLYIIFSVVFLITRLPRIGSDSINPDAVNWHYRSQQFIVGLKEFNFEKTYQHYHPGVTLMWITGVPIELYKQITGIQHYDHSNFTYFHYVAKISVVSAQLVLSLLIIYYLSKIIEERDAVLIMLMMSLEPFFLGNSRLYHMDILFTLISFLALISLYLSLKSESKAQSILTGILFGLSFLTRSIGIGLVLYAVGLCILLGLIKKKLFNTKKLVLIIITFFISVVIMFPAMWVRPVFYISEIFSEGQRIGIRKGHEQVYFGKVTNDPGFLFYPLVFMMKVTPVLIFGIVYSFISFIKSRKKIDLNLSKLIDEYLFQFVLITFYFGYLAAMSLSSKKIDRYIIFMFPLFAYYGYYGIKRIYRIVRNKFSFSAFKFVGVFSLIYICILVINFPYYFTYTSRLFLNSKVANNIIGQKSFGIGIFDLKKYIISNWGEDVKLGFIDTKPMRSIYPNSKIYDIRDYGPGNYDLLILAINEDFPDKVKDDTTQFQLARVFRINGLDYWRIYEKTN